MKRKYRSRPGSSDAVQGVARGPAAGRNGSTRLGDTVAKVHGAIDETTHHGPKVARPKQTLSRTSQARGGGNQTTVYTH